MRIMKPLFVFGIAADSVILLCCAVSWRFDPGDRIHDFLFDRSAVQYVTLFSFALAMTLIGYRFIRYVRSKREVRKIQYCKDWRKISDSPLNNHISTLRDTLARHGGRVALSHAERFAQQQQEDCQRACDVINFLVCSLPALGLFGTMLGLSGALSAAFSKGSFGSDSIQTFVGSLGTALDTTVLALVCAMVAGSTAWLLNRKEKLLHQQQTAVIHAVSGLDGFNLQLNADRPASSRDTRDLDIAETVTAEVQASVAQNMTEITSTFEGSLGRLEELVRVGFERSVQREAGHDQEADAVAAVQAINSYLDQAMARIAELITTHNSETTRTIASAINRFAEAMEASNVVDTVRAELRASMGENMTEITSRLQEHLGSLEELICATLKRSDQREPEGANEASEEVLVRALTSCLDEAMERVGELIITHNGDAIKHVTSALNRFAGAIDERIPRELVISYSRNGNGELNHVA